MPQSSSSQAELKNELNSIFYSAVQANIKLLVNTVRMVNSAASNKGNVGDMLRDSAGDTVQVMGDYLKSSVDNAMKLIDLGVNYTSRLLEGAIENKRIEKNEPAEIAEPPIEVEFSGEPGATLTARITIGNDKDYAVDATFRAGQFVSADGVARIAAAPTFDPTSLRLGPSEKQRVAVSIVIPEDAQPDVYRSEITIEGVPQVRLRFVLTVEGERGKEISISA
jgi:hypothetical protein